VKRSWIFILLAAIAIAALAALWPRSNPPYTIEIRRVATDGTVTYEPQRYEQWNHAANIAGLRRHTKDVIYHSVYFDGLQYCFSRSGHVYAMVGAENDDPSYFDREWTLSGDPHQFPYYDYSKISPHVKP
jgi:hypothetical protein